MPEYTQVQTYVACDEHTFAAVISRFRQALAAVQCTSPEVLDWLVHLEWPSWEEGYSIEYPTLLLQSQETEVPARPYVLFPFAEGQERWAVWVELGILFEAEFLRDSGFPFGPPGTPIVPYRLPAGHFIWRILEAFAAVFLENGVYFTDELQDGRVGSVLMKGKGNFWLYSAFYPQFDAAIIPVQLADRYGPLPELFEQIRLPGALGVVARDHFLALPWKASPPV